MPSVPVPQRRLIPSPAALAAVLPWLLFALTGPLSAFCARPSFEGVDPSLLRAEAKRRAVLTFDAAWSSEGAEAILEILDRMSVKATFFLAGRFIQEHPGLAARISEAGHQVGNHTYSHDHLTTYARDRSTATLPGITRKSLMDEMDATALEFLRATGRALSPIWRAPFGETNREILRWTRRAGYIHVGWSPGMDTLDWVSDHGSPLYRSPERTVERILQKLRRRTPGSIPPVILMHLGSTRTPDERFSRALPALIEGIRSAGYRLVTVGETLPGDSLP